MLRTKSKNYSSGLLKQTNAPDCFAIGMLPLKVKEKRNADRDWNSPSGGTRSDFIPLIFNDTITKFWV